MSAKKNPPMKSAAALALLAGALCTAPAGAQVSGDVVKIGILNDQSGLYADLAGAGSVQAARMAIEEFGGQVLGKKIELVWADHQNKADIGAGIARAWFDREGVDAIADFSNSSVGFAVQGQRAQEDHAGGGGVVRFHRQGLQPLLDAVGLQQLQQRLRPGAPAGQPRHGFGIPADGGLYLRPCLRQ